MRGTKADWGEGPWADEPDIKEWVDYVTGYECLVKRMASMGHFCGYVRVPTKHKLYRKTYTNLHIDVHGGLTYAGHVKGKGKGWWFGFDCAGTNDYVPGIVYTLCNIGMKEDLILFNGVYRNMGYCWIECTRLALQLHSLGEG